jgi:ubiquinone/menaquinone biosynthesis C-methylase UbiE/uncharacterized protein YbaR (Trm112 family)
VSLAPWVCPGCHSDLDYDPAHRAAYRCGQCGREYPVVLGIPDFRLEPDPWISLEDDRAKAAQLDAAAGQLRFDELVRLYWELTPGTPAATAAGFTSFVLNAEQRSREWLDLNSSEDAADGRRQGPWLELGCGTGDLLVAARRMGHVIAGVDVALRWLVVARRRLAEAGVDASLVCANAEHLPFPAASFSRVFSLGTLEHCRDAEAVMVESRRVLQAGGVLRVRTVNRFTLTREPHVGVWGVGFTPRRWADRYVRWRNGQRYIHHRPLSRRELRRGLQRSGFTEVHVGAAGLLGAEQDRLGVSPWLASAYDAARRLPVVRAGLSWIAPLLEGRGRVA